MERAGGAAMLHGPVVVAPPGTPAEDVLGVAAALTAEALALAGPGGIPPASRTARPRPLRLAGRHRAVEHRRSRRLPLRPRPRRTLTARAAA